MDEQGCRNEVFKLSWRLRACLLVQGAAVPLWRMHLKEGGGSGAETRTKEQNCPQIT